MAKTQSVFLDTSSDSEPTEYEIKTRRAHELKFYEGLPSEFKSIFVKVKECTMLSRERLFDFYTSIKYVLDKKIPGDVIEIGCWAGGNIGLARMAIDAQIEDATERKVYGFDTFTGHQKPSEDEVDIWGKNQAERFEEFRGEPWGMVGIEEVKNNLMRIVGRLDGIKLVKGRIEDTAELNAPSNISILRIDVDWYEPTLTSLEKFYPLLSPGGILIIDDYGHHSGSKKAVDKFFEGIPMKFFHIDYSCISAVKD